MQLSTTSPFSNNNFFYITDDDNGIKDTLFLKILGFQPTMGWMFVQKNCIYLFVDDRYFLGVKKRLDTKTIHTSLGDFKVQVCRVESRLKKMHQILTYIEAEFKVPYIFLSPNLVVGQVQEILEVQKLLHLKIRIATSIGKNIYRQAIELLISQKKYTKKHDLDIYITSHKAGMSDDHFLYYLGVNPRFAIMIREGKNIFLTLPESLKNYHFSSNALVKRFGETGLKMHTYFIRSEKTLYKQVFKNIKNKHIRLSPLMTLNQLYALLDYGSTNTFEITREEFETQRVFKNTQELQAHKQAIGIIESVFLELNKLNLQGKLLGKKEKEIVAYIQKSIRHFGGIFESFPSIVSVGKNSAIPHHIPTQTVEGNDKVKNGVILFDIGAVEPSGRCSDFTRVLFVGPKNGQLYQDFCLVEELVYDIHAYAVTKAIAGISVGELDTLTRKFAFKKAAEKKAEWQSLFSRLHYNLQDSFEVHMNRILYSHGLGHGVGLRIHEYPYFSKHTNTKLAPGMCITIEPGVYIPDYFGVRLENLYYVAKSGKLKTYNKVPLIHSK